MEKNKPEPGMAPIYCSLYPELAKHARKHGYALSVHGSVNRDFDLVMIPWAEKVSEPDEVIKTLIEDFKFYQQDTNKKVKNHGRIAYTVCISWGSTFFDISFVLQNPNNSKVNKILKWAKEFMKIYDNNMLVHDCEFISNPMKGSCQDCENYAIFEQLIYETNENKEEIT